MLVFVVGAASALTSSDFCGSWVTSSNVKCSSGQLCEGGQVTTFIVTEALDFFADGTYRRRWRMGTGSCPLLDSSGVLILALDTIGNYTLLGANNATGDDWTKISYDPVRFHVTLLKNNKDVYYTTAQSGPCMAPLALFSSSSLGCSCNGTWQASGFFNTTIGEFQGGRWITKNQCPNTTCPENFFLNDGVRYGNVKLWTETIQETRVIYPPVAPTIPTNSTNSTNSSNSTTPIGPTVVVVNVTTKHLLLSSWSEDMVAGFASTGTGFSFTSALDSSCLQNAEGDTSSPTATLMPTSSPTASPTTSAPTRHPNNRPTASSATTMSLVAAVMALVLSLL